MTWWFALFAIVFLPFVWWAMWREDFDGMRTEAEMKRRPKLTFDNSTTNTMPIPGFHVRSFFEFWT